jgi:hypothetical protein
LIPTKTTPACRRSPARQKKVSMARLAYFASRLAGRNSECRTVLLSE